MSVTDRTLLPSTRIAMISGDEYDRRLRHPRRQPIEIFGVTYASLNEAAAHFGVKRLTMQRRIDRGLTPEQAVTGDGAGRIYTRKTHCKRGHELNDWNVRIFDQNGYIRRQCKVCARERKSGGA